MALPLTGITFTSVNSYTGAAKSDLGQLCTYPYLNKWSKYKPVRYANVAPQRGAGSVWWKANDGNCGLNIPNYSNISLMFTDLRNGVEMWNYLQPTGGASQPFRLGDFGGYEHSAQPPFIPLNLADVYYASTGTITGTMWCALDLRVQSEYELTLADLGLGEMYFGVAISIQGSSIFKHMTESTTLLSGSGGGIDVPLTGLPGMYDVVYFLAENAKTSIDSPGIPNTFIPIPDARQVVQVKESAVTVTITAVWSAGKTSYELYFYSEQGIITLNDCFLNIKYGDNPMPSGPQSGEVTIPLGTIVANTVPESGPVKTGNVESLPDYDIRQGGLIYFTNLSNSAYNVSDIIGSIE